MNETKICCRCKKEKSLEYFGNIKRSKDGKRLDCKSCRKEVYYINHEKMLNEKRNDYYKHKEKYPALVLASVVHNQFENIHPFRDGNGRVGRLLLNYVLLRSNLPPINISLRNRKEYYESLRKYDKEHNIRPMIELILKGYKDLKKIIK